MAVLPYDPFRLDTEVSVEDEPGLTWYIDKTTNRIYGEVDGFAAAKQAVEIILQVQRYAWQIYTPSSGMDWRNLVGQDAGYVAMEVQRRVIDALSMDGRFVGLNNYQFVHERDKLTISFTVQTVFGNFDEEVEVPI